MTSLSHQQRLEAVRAKIVEANLNGDWRESTCGRCGTCSSKFNVRPIRLTDVLLASQAADGTGINQFGWFFMLLEDDVECPQWNLRRDSLDDQSEETISFLHQVLCAS